MYGTEREPAFLSPRQAARLLGVYETTIGGWAAEGLIAVVRRGASVRVPRAEVDRVRTLLGMSGAPGAGAPGPRLARRAED
jgi:excisionase family DNA binding protein